MYKSVCQAAAQEDSSHDEYGLDLRAVHTMG